mmetsp:Transcript_89861/g.164847  ORF Transcript_89861/g.164847 Transcript_89861/m.164847 type:complete len:593 (-) Transcript_89861:84-1862(-)
MSKVLSVRYVAAVHGTSQCFCQESAKRGKSRSLSPQPQESLKAAVPRALKVKDGSHAHEAAATKNKRMRSASPQPHDAVKAPLVLTAKDARQPRNDADIKQIRMRSRSRSASPRPEDVYPVTVRVKDASQPRADADMKAWRMRPRSPSSSPRPQSVFKATPTKMNQGSSVVKDVCHVHGEAHMKSMRMRSSAPVLGPSRSNSSERRKRASLQNAGSQPQDVMKAPVPVLLNVKDVSSAQNDAYIKTFTVRSAMRESSTCGTPLKLRSAGPQPQDVLTAAMPVAWNVKYARNDADVQNLRVRSRSRSVSAQPGDGLKNGTPLKMRSRSRSASPQPQDVSKAAVPVAVPAAVKLNVKEGRRNHYDSAIKTVRPLANLRVFCYGDSNTAGFCSGGKKFEPYSRSLRQALLSAGVAAEVSHVGLSGVTAAEMAEKIEHSSIRDACGFEHEGLRRLIRKHRPDVVIIMVGTNDIARRAPPLQILQHTFHLHDTCHQDGIQTIALAPPSAVDGPGRHSRDHYSTMLKQYASINPNVATFRDAQELLPRGPLGYWEPDIIHLSPAGSWSLGQQLAPLVMQCTKKSRWPQHTLRHEFGGA